MTAMTVDRLDPSVEFFGVVEITPEMAARWLSYNTHNRNEVTRSTAGLVNDIVTDNWVLNGETIKLGTDAQGRPWLIDGQHRLSAVVEADRPVRSYLVAGLSAEDQPTIQETIDTGRKRRIADMLQLRGEKDYNNLAASVRIIHRVIHHADLRAPGYVETPRQLLDLLNERGGDADAEDNGIRHSVRASSTYTILGMPKSLIASLHYLFGLVNVEDRDDFFEKLHTGTMLPPNDPILMLRKWLMAREFETAKPVTYVVAAVTIKAWNYWRQGRPVKLLGWKGGGKHPERYPEIDGLANALERGTPESTRQAA